MLIKPISLTILFILMTLSFPIFGQTGHGKRQTQNFETPRLERNKAYEKNKKESIRHRSISGNTRSKAARPGSNFAARSCSAASSLKYKRK